MKKNIWIGEKIKLRPIAEKDIGTYFKVGVECDTDLERYYDEINFPETKEKMKERIEKMIKQEQKDDEFFWIIEDINGIPVGNIITFSCDRRAGTFKYGLRIEKEFWGNGYGKDAIKIILNYYFRELRYQKVNAYVYSFNERSKRMHESLKFKQEGVLRRVVYTNGEFFDEVYYGMTIEEFDLAMPKFILE